MSIRKVMRAALAGSVAVGSLAFFASDALATSASASVAAGPFAFVTGPTSVSFSDTLSGVDQITGATQTIDVGDATGSGTGWNVTATSTTFSGGGHTLPTDATTVGVEPTVACDASTTCSTASDSVSFPYSLPAGTTAPSATELFNAAADTGMGDQTITPSWTLAIPADTYAGSYTSTWTLSLVSGP
jgi:WxL domain surface cell wall-binding